MPPFSTKSMLHVLRWSLPGGEKAHCGVRWHGTLAAPLDESTGLILHNKGLAMWDSLKVVYGNQTALVGTTARRLGFANNTEATYEFEVAPRPGTSSANALPHEVAVVASLRSATAGRSGRGRIYLPPPAVNMVGSDSRFVATSRQAFADIVADYCAPILGGEMTAVVASFTTSSYYSIVRVGVGDVFDAQRRRRTGLIEVYSTSDV